MISYSLYPTLLDSFYWAKRLGKWQELLDKINRTGTFVPNEAILKGQAFEQAVSNCLLKVHNKIEGDEYVNTFRFSKSLVDRVVTKLQHHQGMQTFVQGQVDTPMGLVKLYGYVDFVYPDFYIDLKTTSSYKVGKYEINAQHKCYPLIGKKKACHYLITDFVDMYVEPYEFTPELQDKFMFELIEFLQWLEANRDKITDRKIWGK